MIPKPLHMGRPGCCQGMHHIWPVSLARPLCYNSQLISRRYAAPGAKAQAAKGPSRRKTYVRPRGAVATQPSYTSHDCMQAHIHGFSSLLHQSAGETTRSYLCRKVVVESPGHRQAWHPTDTACMSRKCLPVTGVRLSLSAERAAPQKRTRCLLCDHDTSTT